MLAAADLQRSVALGDKPMMKKLIDSMQRVQFTNAIAVLEEYGLGEATCEAGLTKSKDVWYITLPSHLIKIVGTEVKNQHEITILNLGEDPIPKEWEDYGK